jgi:hypothetical protein
MRSFYKVELAYAASVSQERVDLPTLHIAADESQLCNHLIDGTVIDDGFIGFPLLCDRQAYPEGTYLTSCQHQSENGQ